MEISFLEGHYSTPYTGAFVWQFNGKQETINNVRSICCFSEMQLFDVTTFMEARADVRPWC